MCGFFGVLASPKNRINENDVLASTGLMRHRGPDSEGFYHSGEISLGHNRLAIFDLRSDGSQPLMRWGKVIVFNGAIYNFIELREDLVIKGYTFSTETDTEVLLAMYDHYGPSCVSRLNGQWSFVIYDEQKKNLFCSRDRFGIKPFYHMMCGGAFYFASEIKAFTAVPSWKAKVNEVRAYEFLTYGMHDHTEETFFAGVYQLKPGHNLDIGTDGRRQETNYYAVRNIDSGGNATTEKDTLRQLETVFQDSISLRLRADVQIGVSLSGGLDSSAIAMYASSINEKKLPLPAYSVIYENREISERPYVERVLSAGRFHPHQLAPGREEFERDLEKLLWHQEEPFSGVGVYAQNRLFELASQTGTKVVLGGQGADEILAGYDKFLLPYVRNNWSSSPIQIIRLIGQLFFRKDFNPLGYRREYLAYRGKENNMNGPAWIKQPARQDFFHRGEERSMRQVSDNLLTSLGLRALLRYEDKNSMAFGVESRLPYLDHRLVELCLRMPDDMKIRDGMNKWALRKISKGKLPEQVLKRRDKLGYATPQEKWFNSDFYSENIDSMNEYLSPFVDIDQVKNVLNPVIGWRLFIFGKWVKKFMS